MKIWLRVKPKAFKNYDEEKKNNAGTGNNFLMRRFLCTVCKSGLRRQTDWMRIPHLQPLAEESEEHGEVDGPGRLVHHHLQVVLRGVLAKNVFQQFTKKIEIKT